MYLKMPLFLNESVQFLVYFVYSTLFIYLFAEISRTHFTVQLFWATLVHVKITLTKLSTLTMVETICSALTQ